MRTKLMIAFVAFGMSAQAQYFNHDYGTLLIDEPQSGMNTVAQHEGFVISGLATNPANGNVGTVVAYSDRTGNLFSAPYFVKGYRVKTTSGVAMNSRDGRVLELGASNFGIAGTAVTTNGSNYYVYYIETDTLGNAVATTLYDAPGCSYYQLFGMEPSSSGTSVYLTGFAQETSTGEYQVFVIKINNNGTLIWSHTYDIDQTVASMDIGYDLYEDNSTGIYRLIVVGKTDYAGSADGFVLNINPNTGAPIWEDIYGNTTSSEYFTTIAHSNDASQNYGYIIGGNTDATTGADLDGWLVRLDNSFNNLWDNTYDYNSSSIRNYFSDVTERLDSAGNYIIYAGGTTATGVMGNADMEVDQIDEVTGNSIAQFTYGDANGNSLVSIDQNSNGTIPGISMFGYRATGYIGNSDLNIYKAYFNGYTSCNDSIDSIAASTGPVLLTYYYPDTVHTFTSYSTTVNVASGYDKTVCYSTTVSGGDNRSMIATQPGGNIEHMSIVNAAEPNSYVLLMSGANGGTVTVNLISMLGTTVYKKQYELAKGADQLQIDLSGLGLGSGVYVLQVVKGTNKESKKIVVVK